MEYLPFVQRVENSVKTQNSPFDELYPVVAPSPLSKVPVFIVATVGVSSKRDSTCLVTDLGEL